MKAKIVCYTLEKANAVTRTKLHRELYGYKDLSNRGKYQYKREGLIHRIKCKKVMDSVIITTDRNVKELTSLLRNYGAKIHVFTVLLKKKL